MPQSIGTRGIPRVVFRLFIALTCLGNLVLLTACGQTAATRGGARHRHVTTSAQTKPGGLVNIPTSCWPRCQEPVMTAFISGALAGSPKAGGGCLWLEPIRGPAKRIPVVWPADFHARLSPVELINAQGRVIARAGDRLQFGGGLGPVRASSRCMFGQGNAAVVQSNVTVRGS